MATAEFSKFAGILSAALSQHHFSGFGIAQLEFHHHSINLLREQTPFQGDFPGGSDGKESACNAGDPGSIPGLGRSPGERNGNPLQYSYLENSIDRGAWWTTLQSMGSQRVGHD